MHTLDNKTKTVMCLGFFDSLHLGHISVIQKAKTLANELGATVTVFSFNGNLKKALFSSEEKVVLLPSERKKALYELGIESTYFMPVSKKYLGLDKREFLDFLTQKFNVSAFVFGEDFRFGKGAVGNVDYIREYASEKGILVSVVDTYLVDNEKVSTTRIKELLENGKINTANELLGKDYFITGKVYKDRGVGTKMGFPTANVKFSKEKALVKKGVYYGTVKVRGKFYKALINYGTRPTFNENELTLEVFLIGFSGNLYDKSLTVYFKEYLREEVKFNDIKELSETIKKDLQRVKEYD